MNRLKAALDKLASVLRPLFAGTMAFLGPVAGSIKGYINPDEVVRAGIAGTIATRSLSGFLTAIYGDMDHILTPEAYQAIMFAVVFFGDIYRRFGQGIDPDKIAPGQGIEPNKIAPGQGIDPNKITPAYDCFQSHR